MPAITQLPPPPSTSDPANFSSKADAHILALQTFTDEVNAFGVELAGADVIATSRDTLTAKATTTDLWNNSKVQDWTATPTITALPNAPQAGSWRVAYPAAGTIITHGGNISVQGNASYTVASGDELTITAVTTTTFYVTIKRKDGTAVIAPSPIIFASSAENIAGTIENKSVDPLGIREAFNATGSAPIYACRAWGNFNGTGTVAILGSGNVSSITDGGTGNYTVNFITVMPDANYSIVFGGGTNARFFEANTLATGSFQLKTISSAGSAVDINQVCFSVNR